jgi:hypothetical protein
MYVHATKQRASESERSSRNTNQSQISLNLDILLSTSYSVPCLRLESSDKRRYYRLNGHTMDSENRWHGASCAHMYEKLRSMLCEVILWWVAMSVYVDLTSQPDFVMSQFLISHIHTGKSVLNPIFKH